MLRNINSGATRTSLILSYTCIESNLVIPHTYHLRHLKLGNFVTNLIGPTVLHSIGIFVFSSGYFLYVLCVTKVSLDT